MKCGACDGLGVRYAQDMEALEDPCTACDGSGREPRVCEYCEDGDEPVEGWHRFVDLDDESGEYRVGCKRFS